MLHPPLKKQTESTKVKEEEKTEKKNKKIAQRSVRAQRRQPKSRHKRKKTTKIANPISTGRGRSEPPGQLSLIKARNVVSAASAHSEHDPIVDDNEKKCAETT